MKITAYLTALLAVLALGTAAAAAGNGVTDFTGRSNDRGDIIGLAAPMHSMEGLSAGGLRTDDRELSNGVTVFKGGAYDTFEIAGISSHSVAGESAGGMREGGPALENGITNFSGASLDREEIGL